MTSFSLNLLIAAIWLLLSTEPSATVFAIGFVVGFVLLAMFRDVLGSTDYVRRCVAFGRFLLAFLRAFLQANVAVARAVLVQSRESLHPNFITYDTTGLTPAEIVLLSYCISLTPGTTTVDVTPDFRTLIVHAFDADDPDAIRADIDRALTRSILGFTR